MVDEFKLLQQRKRGEKAKHLFEDEMIQGFFTDMETRVIQAWKGTGRGEEDLRAEAFRYIKVLEDFKQCFKTYLFTGEIAVKELLSMETKRKAGNG